eukprot:10529976-Heterocapsa_arctica.AAC.1
MWWDGVEDDAEEGDGGVLLHGVVIGQVVGVVLIRGGADVVSEASGAHHGGHLDDLSVLGAGASSPSCLPWDRSGGVGVPLLDGAFQGASNGSGARESGESGSA